MTSDPKDNKYSVHDENEDESAAPASTSDHENSDPDTGDDEGDNGVNSCLIISPPGTNTLQYDTNTEDDMESIHTNSLMLTNESEDDLLCIMNNLAMADQSSADAVAGRQTTPNPPSETRVQEAARDGSAQKNQAENCNVM